MKGLSIILVGIGLSLFSCKKEPGTQPDPVPGAAALYFPPVGNNTWETSTPSSLGWNEAELNNLYAYLQQKNTRAFIILKNYIKKLNTDAHYLGPHSDQHLLYCDWKKRDSLLVTKDSFRTDIEQNMLVLKTNKLVIHSPHFFIPPFEWWNDSIAAWSQQLDLFLFNFTASIRTAVDYTWPELSSYKSSDWIMQHLKELLSTKPAAFNGAIILIHAGTDPRRKDKFYDRLPEVINILKKHGYQFKTIDRLLSTK